MGKLVHAGESHHEFGIISPIQLSGRGDKPEKGFANYTGIRDLKHLPDKDIVEVPFIDAAIWFIRLEVLKNTGLFDPIFYHYGEDIDLTHRMAYMHYKTGFVPTAFGYHDREARELTRKRFFKAEEVYHLAEYTNINYSFKRAFAMGVLAEFKKSMSSLVHGKVGYAATYTGLALSLMNKTNNVLKSRRCSKHIDFHRYSM